MFLAECVITAMVCMWHIGSQTPMRNHSGIYTVVALSLKDIMK